MLDNIVRRRIKPLDEELWRKDSMWFRRAVAYRLLHILIPPQISRRLPARLRDPFIHPGVELPPGTVLPPGVVVPPGTVFPPGWTPGDPAPPGVVIPPGTVFPPGWTPGDPLPPDVVDPPIVPPMPSPIAPVIPPITPGPGPPRPSPPQPYPGGAWTAYFGTAYWVCQANCSWDGVKFIEAGPGMVIKTTGTWDEGFRPTHMRVTGVGGPGSLRLQDALGGPLNIIYTSPSYASLDEVELTWDSFDDMRRMNCYAFSQVTNIEFFE